MVWQTVEVFGILMRWAHIVSAAVLIGGLVYARLVVAPVLGESPEEKAEASQSLAARFRPLVLAAIAGLIVSGLYNFLMHRGHTPYYHAWFGVKILLALHVFAASWLGVRSSRAPDQEEAKRLRRMSGAILSGLAVILIAAYLRLIY
jgi:putative copper export protein